MSSVQVSMSVGQSQSKQQLIEGESGVWSGQVMV
jgi:hypothetical protein